VVHPAHDGPAAALVGRRSTEGIPMHIGVHVMRFDYPPGGAGLRHEVVRAGEAAEAAGVSWLSVMDHYFQMDRPQLDVTDPMLEAYTTLGFLAGRTTRLQLGVPYPSTGERFERLEETLQICLQMWDPTNDGPYVGRHYRLAETLCRPLPLSTPRPEVLIGGSGERKTLRMVAIYADACNLFASSPAEVSHKLEVLRGHCQDVGRDPADIRVTILSPSEALRRGDVDEFVNEVAPYASLGVDTVIVSPPPSGLAAWIQDHVAAAVPRLADLG
jgi:alkanesulfonate monooxygenase SsuD/methylene tetrahydromethanopterin reductase-like flavin-dependent oxidoreductase (luciferase family)